MTQSEFTDIIISTVPCPRCGETEHLSLKQVLDDVFGNNLTRGIEPPGGVGGWAGYQYGSRRKTKRKQGLMKELHWNVYSLRCRTCGMLFNSCPVPNETDLTKEDMVEYITYTCPNISLEDYSRILSDYTYGR